MRGELTLKQAFAQALAGTGLALSVSDSGTLGVKRAGADNREVSLSAVTVTAEAYRADLPKTYAGGQVARGGRTGLLGNKDMMDTPFNITGYTQQIMQDQQARSVADVVLNDPSVRNINPSAGRFDQFTIRGFPIINSRAKSGW